MIGEVLIATGNVGHSADAALLARLELRAMEGEEPMRVRDVAENYP